MVTEVDDDGYVHRELGFDDVGRITHRKPSKSHKHGRFGYFDSPPFDVDTVLRGDNVVELDQAAFEVEWQKPDG
jgi:hypothetical protein